MNNINEVKIEFSNFFFNTNPMWMHAPRHSDAANNLIFVTDGSLKIEVNGNKHTVSANEFMFLPQGVPSQGYAPSNSNSGFYYVTFFSDKSISFPTVFTLPDTFSIRQMYIQLVKKCVLPKYPRDGLNSLLHALLHEVTYQIENNESNDQYPLSEKIKKYLRLSIGRTISITDVANHFGFSTDHVNRIFNRDEHVSIKVYINQLKVQRIEEYLSSTNTPFAVIAQQLGFSSVYALSRFYKYHTGKTLTEYHSKFIN